jgi:hypothetical protein
MIKIFLSIRLQNYLQNSQTTMLERSLILSEKNIFLITLIRIESIMRKKLCNSQ